MKILLKAIIVFVTSLMLLIGALVLVVQIPQQAIKENTYEAAQYLCNHKLFDRIIKNDEGTKVDRYADSILLNINYNMDGSISQLMWASYYYEKYSNENTNLLTAVEQGNKPNLQYLRYWHGSIVILRPLLVLLNIEQIYIFNGILIAILVIILIAILIKNKLILEAISTIIGCVAVSIWVVPMSLEYTWTIQIMLITAIIAVQLAISGRRESLLYLFIVAGVATNFMDFLTTETLTLTVPIILVVRILNKQKKKANSFGFVTINSIAWLVSYGVTWCLKWTLAAFVLHENTLQYITEHVSERIAGDVGVSLSESLLGAIWRNIACVFPMQYGPIGRIAVIVVIVALVYVAYVYKSDKCDFRIVVLWVLIGLIPYARYLILHNHSYLHCFFTYRAQLATILAMIFTVDEIAGGRWPLLGRYKHSDAMSK